MAARVSSHLCGLMTAVTSFMGSPRVGRTGMRGARWSDHAGPGQHRAGRPPGVRAGSGGAGISRGSDRGRVAVAGAHPYDGVDRADPDLPVADATGLRRLDHDAHDVVGVTVVHDDLDADLGHERDVVL